MVDGTQPQSPPGVARRSPHPRARAAAEHRRTHATPALGGDAPLRPRDQFYGCRGGRCLCQLWNILSTGAAAAAAGARGLSRRDPVEPELSRGDQTSGGMWPTSGADMTRGDEHGVEPGALELQHLVAVADVDVGDRELPGRHVREQLERELERVAVVVAAARSGGSPGRAPRAPPRARPRHAPPSPSRARGRALVRPDRDRVGLDGRRAGEPEQRAARSSSRIPSIA